MVVHDRGFIRKQYSQVVELANTSDFDSEDYRFEPCLDYDRLWVQEMNPQKLFVQKGECARVGELGQTVNLLPLG